MSNCPPGQRINELYAWIGIHKNGGEGILSADFDISGVGLRHMPLVTSNVLIIEKLEEIAQDIQQASLDTSDDLVKVVMKKFILSN